MSSPHPPLLVVSTDSFSDTWEIFFYYFNEYFPEFKGKKYLLNETKDFVYDDVSVINSTRLLKKTTKNWGENLKAALEELDEENIFIILDDMILTSRMDEYRFSTALDFFINSNADFVSLSTHDFSRSHVNCSQEFCEVKPFSKYRVTTTPGFWKVKVLLAYLSKEINPWQFEILGTIKSYFYNHKFYMLNKQSTNGDIYPYYIQNGLDTAIVRGKWQSEAVIQFPEFREQIVKRGVVENYEELKQNTYKKVFGSPATVLKYFLS